MQGGEGEQLVAVDDRPGAVLGEHAVAVAVERERDVVAADVEVVDVGRADARVDVAPVRLVGVRGDGGAQAAEDLRRDLVGGAVGAVEEHLDAAQVEVAEALVQAAQVVLLRAVEGVDAADGGAGDGLVEALLDLRFGRVVELEPVAAEELDPVVLVRVVGGRDDGGEVEAVLADQQRRRGGRQDATEQHVPARGGDAGGERRLEHRAGLARVADDEHARLVLAQPADDGVAEAERQVGGEHIAGGAAHAVGAEQPASHGER